MVNEMKTQQQDATQLSKHKDLLCPLPSMPQMSCLPMKMIGSICRKDHLQRKDHHQTAQFEESWLPLPLFLITRNVSNGVAFKAAITNPKNKHWQSFQKPFLCTSTARFQITQNSLAQLISNIIDTIIPDMSHSQMLGKFEYGLPAKFWRLVGCTEMLSW